VELHGKIHPNNVIAIVPARYSSERLPGKMLLDIAGRPLIIRTLDQVNKAASISRVIVATDDERIFNVVNENGGEAVMTSPTHRSGSDRLAEVAESLPTGSIIVNVQGDEPLIAPDTIDASVTALINDESADMSTTCEVIDTVDDVLNPNIVKVVTNEEGYAIYFSRSPIPYPRAAAMAHGGLRMSLENEAGTVSLYRKHTGLYVYRREFLLKFASMEPTGLEKLEMLEQLRALENGARIKVVEVADLSIGVDTPADLERVREIVGQNG
jgi:3-deoxy-manno-octulosonate cytidylyltransferase (CMP-KDO synthetase)